MKENAIIEKQSNELPKKSDGKAEGNKRRNDPNAPLTDDALDSSVIHRITRAISLPWSLHDRLTQTPNLKKNKLLTRLTVIFGLVLIALSVLYVWEEDLGGAFRSIRRVSSKGEAWRPPDIIGCPGGLTNQKYQVWYNQSLLSEYKLTSKDLDVLIEHIIEGKKSIPKHLIEIASDFGAKNSTGLLQAVWNQHYYQNLFSLEEVKKAKAGMDSSQYMAFYRASVRCHYKPFDCNQAKHVWVGNNSLCLLWDNSQLRTKKNIYIYVGVNEFKPRTRWWFGNLRFEEVVGFSSFSHSAKSIKLSVVPYQHKRLLKGKDTVCQSKILTFSGLMPLPCKRERMFENIWTYDASSEGEELQSFRIDMRYYIEVTDINSFSRIQIMEAIAGFVSMALSIDMRQAFVFMAWCLWKMVSFDKKHLKLSKVMLTLLLAGGFLTLETGLLVGNLNLRYDNQTAFIPSQNVSPPTLQFCAMTSKFVDTQKLIKFDVPLEMLHFLSIVSFQSPYYTDTSLRKSPWSLRFPLDFQNRSFFEQSLIGWLSPHHLTLKTYDQVEREFFSEFNRLVNLLGLKQDSSGYEVLKQFLRHPCTIVQKCTINKKEMPDCCNMFQYNYFYTFGLMCIMLNNDKSELKQQIPGRNYGLKVFLNATSFIDDQVYVGKEQASFLGKSGHTISVSDAEKYMNLTPSDATDLFGSLFVMISQRDFGPYGYAELYGHTANHSREFAFKYSTKSDELLEKDTKPSSYCSKSVVCAVSDWDTAVPREIFTKSLCGCHMCSATDIKEFQQNCCPAKKLYPCFTQDFLYSHNRSRVCDLFYGTKDIFRKQVSIFQGKTEIIDTNDLFGFICNAGQWGQMNETVLYPYMKDQEVPVDCGTPCHKRTYVMEGREQFPTENDDANITVINAYQVSSFVQTMREQDVFKPILILSLFGGGLGLVLGLSILDLIQGLITTLVSLLSAEGNLLDRMKSVYSSSTPELGHRVQALLSVCFCLCAALFSACVSGLVQENFEYPDNQYVLEYSRGVLPSAAICSNEFTTWQAAESRIGSWNCTLFDKVKKCEMVFPYFLENQQGPNCVLAKELSEQDNSSITVYTTEMKIVVSDDHTEKLWIWVGSWLSLKNQEVNPQYDMIKNGLDIMYKRTIFQQVPSMYDENGCIEYMSIDCPECSASRETFCSFQAKQIVRSDPTIPRNREPCFLESFSLISQNTDLKHRTLRVHLGGVITEKYIQVLMIQSWSGYLALIGGFIGIFMGYDFLAVIHNVIDILLQKFIKQNYVSNQEQVGSQMYK